ncbi:MAG: UMP kinase [Prevotellaceae bacterium]|jgi:uridylate kinase|nr:UMP kinase [Prevotellaceae bacterium]
MIKYQRILLKLSGESLAGNSDYGISPDVLSRYSSDIASITEMGVQVAIVIGGGNIFRGISGANRGFDRIKGDNMGMLATVINSLAIQSAMENAGIKAKVLTSVRMEPVGAYYSSSKAIEYLESGTTVIIAGGTGNPFFTTDSAAALRGIELKADILLKGTRVDGVYTDDPEKHPEATKYSSLSFDEAYTKGLKIMDLTAFTLCRENSLPILVFDMNTPGNLKKIISGSATGTIIK